MKAQNGHSVTLHHPLSHCLVLTLSHNSSRQGSSSHLASQVPRVSCNRGAGKWTLVVCVLQGLRYITHLPAKREVAPAQESASPVDQGRMTAWELPPRKERGGPLWGWVSLKHWLCGCSVLSSCLCPMRRFRFTCSLAPVTSEGGVGTHAMCARRSARLLTGEVTPRQPYPHLSHAGLLTLGGFLYI